MKQIMNGGGGGGGGGLRLPTEDEVEVAEILLSLSKLIAKSELIHRYSFAWGVKKKRSVLVSKSESSPSRSPSTQRRIGGSTTEKVTAAEADKSPSTPLCFLPSGSGSDGVDKRKAPSTVKKSLKRKAPDNLVESYNRMHQEREVLLKETKAMKTLHQKLTSANLELKTIIQKVNYSRNIEDYHQWNKSMKIIDQQSYHPQITMFAPPTPQQQHQHCQQMMAVSCSGNSQGGGGGGGGGFGMFNQIDPRVRKVHGETYDFMGCSQPLDQSKYLMMDNDLRVRSAAAAARKRRILRMKENKNALLALKLSRGSR